MEKAHKQHEIVESESKLSFAFHESFLFLRSQPFLDLFFLLHIDWFFARVELQHIRVLFRFIFLLLTLPFLVAFVLFYLCLASTS